MRTKVGGRPPFAAKPRRQMLLTADPDDVKRINVYCDSQGVTRSSLMVRATLKAIAAKTEEAA